MQKQFLKSLLHFLALSSFAVWDPAQAGLVKYCKCLQTYFQRAPNRTSHRLSFLDYINQKAELR
jgi:hypothetical protein